MLPKDAYQGTHWPRSNEESSCDIQIIKVQVLPEHQTTDSLSKLDLQKAETWRCNLFEEVKIEGKQGKNNIIRITDSCSEHLAKDFQKIFKLQHLSEPKLSAAF